MNILFYVSLLFLLISYPYSLNGEYGTASVLYLLTVLTMVGGALTELDTYRKRKKMQHLKVVK